MMVRQFFYTLFCAALLASCDANEEAAVVHHEEATVAYHMADQPYVDRALAFYSGNGKISLDQVLREVSPVVVHLPTMICVGLNLRVGTVGGDTTVCYSRENGKQILHFVNGE
ncbi:hypothetical protein [Blastomonas sp.]|uniref:hypothetical protein n=1 Tax=Blastomonas sp. TaxID=1909299 RepID=UPI003593891E